MQVLGAPERLDQLSVDFSATSGVNKFSDFVKWLFSVTYYRKVWRFYCPSCADIHHYQSKTARKWDFLWYWHMVELHFNSWIDFSFITCISQTLLRMWLWLPVCAMTALQRATFGSLACRLYLNPQEMENSSLFLKPMLKSDEVKVAAFQRHRGLATSLVSLAENHCKRMQKINEVYCCAAEEGHKVPAAGVGWWTTDSPRASFSLLACRGELLCYFPFHTSVRGQTQQHPPPTEMPLFWGCIPCLEWGWTKKLYETASAVRNKPSTNELDERSLRWTAVLSPQLQVVNTARGLSTF